MATACLENPRAGSSGSSATTSRRTTSWNPAARRPRPSMSATGSARASQSFYGGRVAEVLAHPRFRLHIVTSRGRHVLGREHKLRTPLGYLGAFLTNSVHRRAMGAWLERVVFSSAGEAGRRRCHSRPPTIRTRQVPLNEANFNAALQASCSIPFVLKAIHDIPRCAAGRLLGWRHHGLPPAPELRRRAPGRAWCSIRTSRSRSCPGWLDKGLCVAAWRNAASSTAPWCWRPTRTGCAVTAGRQTCPIATDFMRFGTDLQGRVQGLEHRGVGQPATRR